MGHPHHEGAADLERRAMRAYREACRVDVAYPKPGNVSVRAPAHGMTARDFLRSARVSAAPISRLGLGIGERVLQAVRATREEVGCNTNLGIVLLCAPLLHAWQHGDPAADLRAALRRSLRGLDLHDAGCAFRAIALAAPAGLGDSPRHDVRQAARVDLLQAMREAAPRDRVAAQYADDYAGVFELGVPTLRARRGRDGGEAAAVALTFLEFLCAFDDSHVARKQGAACARDLRERALRCRDEVLACADWTQARRPLGRLDSDCRRRGINPGTTADLTVAAWLAERLGAGTHAGAGRCSGSTAGEARPDDQSLG